MKIGWKRFWNDFRHEVKDDNVGNGAAALAYYLMLAVFPAMIVVLAALPYLPIQNIDQAIMDFIGQALPGEAAGAFTGTVQSVTSDKKGGLLSGGILFTLWAASNGMYAIMQQLNITYDVKEERSFLKARGVALLLTLMFGVLIIGAFGLVVFGGKVQEWLASSLGWSGALLTVFAVIRWAVIGAALALGFALIYYLAPNVEQKFKFVSPGSVFGVVALVAASLGFRYYVSNFGSYNATYGSIGAVIVLMLWLYIAGLVLLLGSEVNALLEHYSDQGKSKGQKREPDQAKRHAA